MPTCGPKVCEAIVRGRRLKSGPTIRFDSVYSLPERGRIRLALAMHIQRYGYSLERIFKNIQDVVGAEAHDGLKDRRQVYEFINGAEQRDSKIKLYLEYLQQVEPLMADFFRDDENIDKTATVLLDTLLDAPTSPSYSLAQATQAAKSTGGLYAEFTYFPAKDYRTRFSGRFIFIRSAENLPYFRMTFLMLVGRIKKDGDLDRRRREQIKSQISEWDGIRTKPSDQSEKYRLRCDHFTKLVAEGKGISVDELKIENRLPSFIEPTQSNYGDSCRPFEIIGEGLGCVSDGQAFAISTGTFRREKTFHRIEMKEFSEPQVSERFGCDLVLHNIELENLTSQYILVEFSGPQITPNHDTLLIKVSVPMIEEFLSTSKWALG